MRISFRLLAIPLLLLPTACIVGSIAKGAVDVVTLPVKAVSAGVDKLTTSQAEADQKRGREMRRQEEQRGRLAREMDQRCRAGRPLPDDLCQSPLPPR